jgi:hypothetical protein
MVKILVATLYLALFCVSLGCRSDPHNDPQTMWSYREPGGRVVYVNGWNAIPEHYRTHAERVDLSHVDTNTSLGNAYRDAASSTPAATEARQTDERGPVKQHLPLIVALGTAVLLLVLTPFIGPKVGSERWNRTLLWALPLLLVLGGMADLLQRFSGMVRTAKTKAAGSTQGPNTSPPH